MRFCLTPRTAPRVGSLDGAVPTANLQYVAVKNKAAAKSDSPAKPVPRIVMTLVPAVLPPATFLHRSAMRSMTQPTLEFLGALLIACLPVGVIVYLQALRHLRRKGPRVKTAVIGFPDLLVTIALVTFLVLQTAQVLFSASEPEPVKITHAKILSSILIFLGFMVLLFAFLHVREINLRRFFGLHFLRPIRSVLLGLGFIAAAFPIVFLIGSMTQRALGADAREQELVRIFRESFIQQDLGLLALLASAAAITQPLCEEVFFRGYFYVVGKRYLGAIASACLTSTLFAAVHFNLAAFPALIVLALCLTLAYEVTGSILVPFSMHALFNSTQLLLLAWQTRAFPVP